MTIELPRIIRTYIERAVAVPIKRVAGSERKLWLDLIDTTTTTAEGLVCSDHFLYIGRAK